MLTGIKLKANPTSQQRLILSQWMGCARLIWNAKVSEEKYYRTFARKYCPIGVYAPIDQKTSHFKSKELTPWLYQCPSQIIRNSAVNWFKTYQKFMKGACGKPRRKPKRDCASIHLTRELFSFEQGEDGNSRLFIGSKTNNIGYLSVKNHAKHGLPSSLYIKKERGRYFVSFCYENDQISDEILENSDHLMHLKGATVQYLQGNTLGVDRGVTIPVHAGGSTFDFTDNQKKSMLKSQRFIKRAQKRLAKQKLTSNRRRKTKQRLAKHHAKRANVRNDFAHKTSYALVNKKESIIIFEDLKTSNMTRKPKVKIDEKGRFIANKAKQKAGLNKAILNVGWHKIETYVKYKAKQKGKAFFKIPAPFTSQECAKCDHIHPDNRQSQEDFLCLSCGHADNADRNAALVIKKRAIKLILNTGTVLSERGVLRLKSGTGRGGDCKSSKPKSKLADANETSKKISLAA